LPLDVTDGVAFVHETNDENDDNQQRRKREKCVIRKGRPHAGSVVLLPFIDRLPDEFPRIEHTSPPETLEYFPDFHASHLAIEHHELV
jgi:hypothetical protein